MTVKECFEHAMSMVPEEGKENPELLKFAVMWCNLLLAETIRHENLWRRINGIEELREVPKLNSENEEIPYNEEMVKAAFPYGMARWIFRENDDVYGSHEYYQLYTVALSESVPVLFGEVEDLYR